MKFAIRPKQTPMAPPGEQISSAVSKEQLLRRAKTHTAMQAPTMWLVSDLSGLVQMFFHLELP
jgi:hypothetical protein